MDVCPQPRIEFSTPQPSTGNHGEHSAPRGDSNQGDSTRRNDPRLALWLFEQERRLYASTADRAW